jgi:hypothetical protein
MPIPNNPCSARLGDSAVRRVSSCRYMSQQLVQYPEKISLGPFLINRRQFFGKFGQEECSASRNFITSPSINIPVDFFIRIVRVSFRNMQQDHTR